MKQVILLGLLFISSHLLNAQVGINTTNPDALLDIRSSNQATPANIDGILIPKVDDFPVANPTANQDGMMVFVTGNGVPSKGLYYWNNTTSNWVAVIGVKHIDDLIDGKSDNDGTNDGSSIFLGIGAGVSDDGNNNKNVGIGFEALNNSTTAYENTANGYQALKNNTSGFDNTAIGTYSLFSNTIGNYNTAIGSRTLINNTTASLNVAIGSRALARITTGERNTATGTSAMYNNVIGNYNTVNGARTLLNNTTGNNNTVMGYETLFNNITGSGNIAIGYNSGYNETGSNKLYIENSSAVNPLIYGEFDNDILGFNAEVGIGTQSPSASLHINHPNGAGSEGIVISNQVDADVWRIYQQWNSNTLALFFNNVNVGNFDDVSGIYTPVSDRRLKTGINPFDNVLTKIKGLEVVNYRFKHQKDNRNYVGLIAQDVQTIFPHLVYKNAQDEDDQLTMDYSGFGVLAVKAIQEQQEVIDSQQEQIDELKKELLEIKILLKQNK
ncbi:tail fiber domain-containing protein [Psychroserpens sp. MEBiC05023]